MRRGKLLLNILRLTFTYNSLLCVTRCGHCKRMKPDYAKAALMLETEQLTGSKVAAVDCTVHRKLSERFEIRGFPTMKFFKKGQVTTEYDGKRTAEAIVDYIKTSASQSTKDEL